MFLVLILIGLVFHVESSLIACNPGAVCCNPANYNNCNCWGTDISCWNCPIGTYQPESKQRETRCTQCPWGTANNQVGSSSCTTCNSGMFFLFFLYLDTWSCILYNGFSHPSVLLIISYLTPILLFFWKYLILLGTFAAGSGSVSCTPCSPGIYQPSSFFFLPSSFLLPSFFLPYSFLIPFFFLPSSFFLSSSSFSRVLHSLLPRHLSAGPGGTAVHRL